MCLGIRKFKNLFPDCEGYGADSEYDWSYMAFIRMCGTHQQMTTSFAAELFH
jgi:hypothetical protein